MTRSSSMAITADLHWGHRKGREATLALAEHVRQRRPEVLILGGDIGVAAHFEEALSLFEGVGTYRVLVPGNHDLWVGPEAEHDSLDLYDRILPAVTARHGFHYLDHGPLLIPEAGVSLVGSINWYDYSWSLGEIRRHFPEEEWRLESKRLSRGRHNDANFIRWSIGDQGFTSRLTATLERHLDLACSQAEKVIVVTHHPPIHSLAFQEDEMPQTLDRFLWEAFCGNIGVETLLGRYGARISHLFCGHMHRERETVWNGIQGYNIGGDYDHKRLLWLDWPTGNVQGMRFECE